MIAWREGWISKGHKESLRGEGNTHILTMSVVIQMYTTVKIHQTVDIKWIHFIVQKLHLNKLLKNKGTSIYVKCPILQGPRP